MFTLQGKDISRNAGEFLGHYSQPSLHDVAFVTVVDVGFNLAIVATLLLVIMAG